jgi:hypothetical protein
MIAPNFTLAGAVLALPQLNDLMSALYYKDPKLSFKELHRYTKTVDYPDGNGNRIPQDTCLRVNVKHGQDIVGELSCEVPVKLSDSKTVFRIMSKNIKKARRPFGEIKTSNSKVALREALKYFTALTEDEIKSEVLNVKKYLQHVYESVDFSYTRIGDSQEVITYFVDLHRGNSPRMPISVEKEMTKKLLDKVDNRHIVKSLISTMKNNSGHGAEILADGQIRLLNFKTDELVKADSIYGLPEWAQLKISMLKMLTGTQAIKDIGCRFEESVEEGDKLFMYITDGEMTHLV